MLWTDLMYYAVSKCLKNCYLWRGKARTIYRYITIALSSNSLVKSDMRNIVELIIDTVRVLTGAHALMALTAGCGGGTSGSSAGVMKLITNGSKKYKIYVKILFGYPELLWQVRDKCVVNQQKA